MTTQDSIPDIKSSTIVSTDFHHFVGGFVIDLPCIITNDNTVFIHDEYSLIDFTDINGGFIETYVRFFHAYLKGYVVTIVLLDLESGELIKRKHRLNNDSVVCNWVLTDLFNNQSEPREQLLQDFRDRK